MLSDNDITLVKQTIPTLEASGSDITQHFYQRMFRDNPELKDIFNLSHQRTGNQAQALFDAILAYAKNIDRLHLLEGAVSRIAHKHTSFAIKPAHYKIVGHHLIATFKELLQSAFTLELESAWINAYNQLAEIFIDKEEQLYSENETSAGGWRGKREFVIQEKTRESDLVTSFVLCPKDKLPVKDFLPGQYIGVEIRANNSPYQEIRQYSLSDKPNETSYRISVKRESTPEKGIVSNHLHDNVNEGDIIDIHAPAGDFTLKPTTKPVVLISAGVGITPLQSMLEYLATTNYSYPVQVLHACESPEQHSFYQRSKTLTDAHSWDYYIWYNQLTNFQSSDQPDAKLGLMDLTQVSLPVQEGDFYVCGPVGFINAIKQSLLALGVSVDRIHYELFGPHQIM